MITRKTPRTTRRKASRITVSKQRQRRIRDYFFRNGIALQNHIRSAHREKPDPMCAACKELKSRMKEGK